MEAIRRRHITSKFAPEDVISNMPDIVITNILDRLPIQDAVRTGILAREWRNKWTMLSQLVFDWEFFKYLVKRKAVNNYGRIISRLLLQLKGTITKFVLYIEERGKLDDEEINHWILFLSTKGIKDITIWKMQGQPLKLPTHLFSCLELKRLELYNCTFNPPSSFHGFPNLLTLEFIMVENTSKFWEFVTHCPLLQTLKVPFFPYKVNLVEIANLKILSLSLFNLFHAITTSSAIFELLSSFPKLEELNLDFIKCKFTQVGDRKRSPTSFPCLKALILTSIDLGNQIMLSCAFELIRCSPNLQTLEITTYEYDVEPPPAIPEVDYNTMEPLQLRSVVFVSWKGSENDVWLIKYLLACSPFLKKIVIGLGLHLQSDEKLKFSSKLLMLHRSSPVVDIGLY